MLPKKYRLFIVMALCLLVALSVQAASLEQKSTLSGKVSAQSLAVKGAVVREGQVLACIESINGPVPAARANIDGVVVEVLVKAGDAIHSGQVVAKIGPAQ